jgi:hypothetical protein
MTSNAKYFDGKFNYSAYNPNNKPKTPVPNDKYKKNYDNIKWGVNEQIQKSS